MPVTPSDPGDIDIAVGARQAGSSHSETDDLMGFSRQKQKPYSEQRVKAPC